MPLYVTLVCDEPDCNAAEGLAFDSQDETYGDLISAIREAGYQIEDETAPRAETFSRGRVRCPKCIARG